MFRKCIAIILLLCGQICFARPDGLTFGYPHNSDLILHKHGFSIGYSKTRKQALWVCYILSADELAQKQVRRSDKFRLDPAVKRNPVRPQDYARTGYDKGHLAPAADMTYSYETMSDSFFMTNISPQKPGCNRGIWKRLEKQVRLWAMREQELYIITGPIFKKRNKRLGEAKIPIPYAFYKVILDMTPPMKMIGFIVPNESSKSSIRSFAVSVDEVECATGYDFFGELPDELENKLEANINTREWFYNTI